MEELWWCINVDVEAELNEFVLEQLEYTRAFADHWPSILSHLSEFCTTKGEVRLLA